MGNHRNNKRKHLKKGLDAPILMTETKCVSTKQSISNDVGSVQFPCPECDRTIIRSKKARVNGTKYQCPCGFAGP